MKNPLGVENVKFNCYCENLQGEVSEEEFKEALSILVETEKYIKNFDKEKMEQEGCAYDINVVTSEDKIDNIFEKLEYVDRKRALAGIYKIICGDLEINTENHEKLQYFLGKVSYHPIWTETVTYKSAMLYDPLVLLEIKEMKCGQVNRIIYDLVDSVGGMVRGVQLGGHVIAEIYYDSEWHYFDADAFVGGDILKINGKIPSVQMMSEVPYLIDQFGAGYRELMINDTDKSIMGFNYPSSWYFCKEKYSTKPYFFYKIATDYECLNELYGWNHYDTIDDKKRKLDAVNYMCVGIPTMVNVKVKNGRIYLKWKEPFDEDKDILGYRIYVSKKSRGWEYSGVYAEGDAVKYIEGSYYSDQYDFVTTLPFSDILYIETTETEAIFELDERDIYYISVMPFDKHGEEMGVELYFPSNELRVNTSEE